MNIQPLSEKINKLYGKKRGEMYLPSITSAIRYYRRRINAEHKGRDRMTHRDIFLITYPDQVQDENRPCLTVLKDVLDRYFRQEISAVHILPFFPYSSDDGFSVIDYKQVGPGYGGWNAIEEIGHEYRLMADCVLNHISAQSRWFREYLSGSDEFADFFISTDPETDLSSVVRPRTSPLLHKYTSSTGTKHIWTTFSRDQVDLNFKNPDVLLRMIEIMLFYIRHTVSVIRMDAIAYIWKEIGTSCIHLPQVHTIIKLIRGILDIAAPETFIITETNVPHKENISYLGNGHDEAQLVYQFSLPPLTAHALLTENSTYLTSWAQTLDIPSGETTYFNFTASHDGIGVRPAEGLIPDADITLLAETAQKRGGRVSSKTNSDGTESPYELNINYFSLLTAPNEPGKRSADRFLCSQAIMLAMPGVPAAYIHSLIGSTNYTEGVKKTGHNRTINREKLKYTTLRNRLSTTPGEYILTTYKHMIRTRIKESSFDPCAPFRIMELHDALFAIERTSPDRRERVYALHNTSAHPVTINRFTTTPLRDLHVHPTGPAAEITPETITVPPLMPVWLKT